MAKSPYSRRRKQLVGQFRRAAGQRREEALFLLQRGQYTTASVYLAGYTVECILKALILASDRPKTDPDETLREFIGAGARSHNFEHLREQLRRRSVRFPQNVLTAFAKVRWWQTDLRYSTLRVESEAAEDFLHAVAQIWAWANGRL